MIRLLACDLETTGVSVYEDRIVTAYLGLVESDGSVSIERNWIVDPGIPIPEDAAAVHGYSTSRIQAEGRKDVPTVIREILEIIVSVTASEGVPLCGFNLSYDLTLLESERQRHQPLLPPLDFDQITVYDGLVIDKAVDKWRKGSRKLIDTARHYGVPITEDEAHAASFDAVASARIIQALLRKPALAHLTPRQLHEKQIGWKRDQARGLQEYFRSPKGGKPDAVVNGGWPVQDPEPERTAA